jgi:hypothetical protein
MRAFADSGESARSFRYMTQSISSGYNFNFSFLRRVFLACFVPWVDRRINNFLKTSICSLPSLKFHLLVTHLLK